MDSSRASPFTPHPRQRADSRRRRQISKAEWGAKWGKPRSSPRAHQEVKWRARVESILQKPFTQKWKCPSEIMCPRTRWPLSSGSRPAAYRRIQSEEGGAPDLRPRDHELSEPGLGRKVLWRTWRQDQQGHSRNKGRHLPVEGAGGRAQLPRGWDEGSSPRPRCITW